MALKRIGIAALFLIFAANLSAGIFKKDELRTSSDPKYSEELFSSKKEYLAITKGREFARKSDYPKAIEQFTKAIEFNPRSSAFFWKGLAHEQMALEKIIFWNELEKNNVGGTHKPDRAFIEDQYQKAVDSFKQAAEFFPQVDYIHFSLGKAYKDYQSNIDAAVTELELAAQLNPEAAHYKIDLAEALLLKKRFKDTNRVARETLQDGRALVQAASHLILGRLAMEEKNYTKAIESLKQSLAADNGYSLVYYYLSKSYANLQDFEKAADAGEKFIKYFLPTTLREADLLEDAKGGQRVLENKKR